MPQKKKKIKRTARERKKLRLKKKIRGTDACPRVSVFRSSRYTTAQVISDESGKTLAQACTKESDVASQVSSVNKDDLHAETTSTKGVVAAKAAGVVLAGRVKALGFEKVVFDRNGYLYHGRIKALADGLREGGITV